MKIENINMFHVQIDELECAVLFNETKKKLEELILKDKEIDGTFRPLRFNNQMKKDKYFFKYF